LLLRYEIIVNVFAECELTFQFTAMQEAGNATWVYRNYAARRQGIVRGFQLEMITLSQIFLFGPPAELLILIN